jgi:stage V sporulation protein R
MTGHGLLYEGAEWDFDKLRRTYDAIEAIGVDELGLDLYRNQIEVITAEQMLDAYAGLGMPLMYRHWSFGKRFIEQEMLYRKGLQGLALEMVINSDPSICYIMEENTMTAQAVVLAHAAMGHNHFFKTNQAFRTRTDAGAILDYLSFARNFVASCEERYGPATVERVLDAAHSLSLHAIDHSGKRRRPRVDEERARLERRRDEEERAYNDLWRTVPSRGASAQTGQGGHEPVVDTLKLPEENLLYFIEKNALWLDGWQRELLRIVRIVANYFEPQRQTKVMNEGCATWCHYTIMNRLHKRGQIDDSAMLEFLHLHSSVIAQPDFDSRRFGGLNPYALGFAMMRDIERACTDPTDEDHAWFPDHAGNGDPVGTLKAAWADYRDESFVLQFLSPRIIRDFRLFKMSDDKEEPEYLVDAIHDERGFRRIRSALAATFDPLGSTPVIEIVAADLRGDRKLVLQHTVQGGRVLDALEARRVLRQIRGLWGYPVVLLEVDGATGAPVAEHQG